MHLEWPTLWGVLSVGKGVPRNSHQKPLAHLNPKSSFLQSAGTLTSSEASKASKGAARTFRPDPRGPRCGPRRATDSVHAGHKVSVIMHVTCWTGIRGSGPRQAVTLRTTRGVSTAISVQLMHTRFILKVRHFCQSEKLNPK